MAPVKKKRPVAKKNKGAGFLILGVTVLGSAALFLPTTIILMIGMLPTAAAAFVDKSGKNLKALTVGGMNLAGTMPFLFDLWASDHTMGNAFRLITNPRTIIVIYCAAAIGYMIEWAMTGIVTAILSQRAEMRLRDIKKAQDRLVQKWGPEVTGELPLDESGFPLESGSLAKSVVITEKTPVEAITKH